MLSRLEYQLATLSGISSSHLANITGNEAHSSFLGDILVSHNLLSEVQMLEACANELGVSFSEATPQLSFESDFLESIPVSAMRAGKYLPYRSDEGQLYVGSSNPLETHSLDTVSVLTGEPCQPIFMPATAIERGHELLAGEPTTEMDETLDELGLNQDVTLEAVGPADLLDASSAPLVRLVNQILSQAARRKASDIHLEPFITGLNVRFRLDGVLQEVQNLPPKIIAPVSSRLKIMAGLDIAEKRLPQDGRITLRLGNREIDFRVSTLPTPHGERIVLRLLEKSSQLLSLDEIGLSHHSSDMQQVLSTPNGIILVTGPTGSGKTTSLYAVLNHLRPSGRNILTIENPIEYQLEGIGQMQVNEKIGLTFAKGLRTLLRQDPDVVLIGEIRDRETAETAVQSALTGHLVFSTLHTNDAPGALTRLVDMNVEPFLVTSAVRAVISQRLVRILCTKCKQSQQATTAELEQLGLPTNESTTLFHPVGCPECSGTGYKGRTAIYEFMHMTNEMQSLLLQTSAAGKLRQLAQKQGMATLREEGIRKVLSGQTTLQEIMLVTA